MALRQKGDCETDSLQQCPQDPTIPTSNVFSPLFTLKCSMILYGTCQCPNPFFKVRKAVMWCFRIRKCFIIVKTSSCVICKSKIMICIDSELNAAIYFFVCSQPSNPGSHQLLPISGSCCIEMYLSFPMASCHTRILNWCGFIKQAEHLVRFSCMTLIIVLRRKPQKSSA